MPYNLRSTRNIPEHHDGAWMSSLPPEVWTIVGEHTQNRRTLLSLVKVCRTFRDLFTPVLHAHQTLPLHEIPDAYQHSLPTTLKYAKRFEVRIGEYYREITYKLSMNEGYAALITRMLKEMPNLRSFEWVDDAFDTAYGPPLVLRNKKLLNMLARHEALKRISITFASNWLDHRKLARNCWMPLTGFRNLTSLELYNFYGKESMLKVKIARVLSQSPNLETLGLAMACDCACFDLPEAVILEGECDFLEGLCVEYGSLSNTAPLKLRTFRIGTGVYLFKSKGTESGNYLPKLVDVSKLEQFHIFNDLVKIGSAEEDHSSMDVDWSLLDGCSALYQLSVSCINADLREWLNGPGNAVQELYFTHHYSMYDSDLNEFSLLNLPHLSALFTRELTVRKRTFNFDTDSSSDSSLDSDSEMADSLDSDSEIEMDSDLDSDLSDEASDGDERFELGPGNMRERLSALIAASRETAPLQAITQPVSSKLDISVMTVLDRLPSGGAQLKKLNLCLNLEAQWTQFATHLPKLNNLTQLSIHSKSHRTGQYPTVQSSLWPGIRRAKDLAFHYAQLIHSLCPSLRYIQIQYWAWRIILPSFPPSNIPIFEQLSYEEITAIDLFAMENFPSQCGLTGVDREHEEFREEEYADMNEREKSFQEEYPGEYV